MFLKVSKRIHYFFLNKDWVKRLRAIGYAVKIGLSINSVLKSIVYNLKKLRNAKFI